VSLSGAICPEQNIIVNGEPEKMGYALEWQGQFIGGIGFTAFDHKAEIGYWIARPYWGRGLMTEAVTLFIVYLRKKYRFTRFEGKVFSFNSASGRVLEKCGFQKEGVLIHDFRVGKKYFDHIVYGRVYK
jgi:RimJ/RimL family protein N-acetyltransferase